ncbi:NADP-dependent phosphogluconate dehydrogenase [Catenuloplanes indicus]|uniref:6-phosphogluconate dehydrogenase, decarboxylating n=1 Tax=Catenuloplanes indicus TaxID=137267 RepID=A0AAE3W776_9ACTN|nr:NADP-dependent phosphogluconate dehydrogenase [Catenuloplanes indicus]MDQ0370557.1 6-phosphogluconate dehydrogenase [Catenuloplanes indicus]
MTELARIGVTGLSVMGRNLARNLARHGHVVAVHNRTENRTKELIEEFGHEGAFVPAQTAAEFVAAIARPRKIIVMVTAGDPTDRVIDELTPLLDPGDMIIDGGNANVAETIRREEALREKGLHFVGAGISGGEEGALHGPSIMPGGSAEAYAEIGPILEGIAARVDGRPCCTHVGPDGAGHFVKTVHNGIEYADMQLIAEAYDLLRKATNLVPDDIAEVFAGWNEGRLASYLVEITAEVLGQVDAETGRPFVDVVMDRAEQKGTGRWTVQAALDLGTPVPGIAEAVFARTLSGQTELRAAARELPGPPPGAREASRALVEDIEKALYASKIVVYAQGFHQIATASAEFGWKVDLGAMARIWRGGCIIRARFLDRIWSAYNADPDLPTLLTDEYFREALTDAQKAWRRVVSTATWLGIPVPGLSSALAYYDGLRAQRLPAALIQGQRDYFGAHGYRRVDRAGTYHTAWSGNRGESPS